jgi:putative glutamine amidotransferase
MMKKPTILITAGQAYDRQFRSSSLTLFRTYTAAVVKAGGLPIVPLDFSPESLSEYVDMADGCIFAGTQEYSPVPGPLRSEEHEERNRWEQPLMRAMIASGKPILGICLGMQHLNVALGGDLKRRFRLTDKVEHNGTVHPVETVEGSLLHRLAGKRFLINSLHTVRVDHLAPCLRATAFSPDGVIEAYEHESLPLYGFQFHPEKMRGDFPYPVDGPNLECLFEEFIRMCNR